MRIFLGSFILAIIVPLLSGCMGTIAVVNGIDASIAREPYPDDGKYIVILKIEGKEPEVTEFRLENYYDAQASTRGNYWSKRFYGSQSSERILIETTHDKIGRFALVLMGTQYIEKQDYPNFRAFFIKIDDETYWESTDNPGLFFTRDPQGRIIEKYQLNYRLDIEYIPDEESTITQQGDGVNVFR